MAVDASKQPRVSDTLPPRTLNVQKFAESRASELETLHSIVANRLESDFRSNRNKRRRTTGYDDRVAKNRHRRRQKLGLAVPKDAVVCNKGQEKLPRRIRRRIELKKNHESGFLTSGDGTKRLRTHVWHAKRFTMTKTWGFHIPLGLHGRGRGSRALLKRFADGVLVHDESYHSAVQLEGSQDSLIHMLNTIFIPCRSSKSEDINVLSGVTYGRAMLHHVGAPFSPAVAPVIYMWRPFHQQNIISHTNCDDADKYISRCSTSRKLWVWIHASAFNEGYDALKLACQKQMDEAGVSINCISLQGKLAKLEVMGSKAFVLLQKILHPVTSVAENPWRLKKCSNKESVPDTHSKEFSIPENISYSALIPLTVNDPRVLSERKVEPGLKKTPVSKESHMSDDESKSMELLSSSSLKVEEDSLLPHHLELWDVSKGVLPPVEEKVMCTEKQQQQLALFCLGNTNSEKQIASNGEGSCRLCPIMLLNNSEHKGSIDRWSIILPLSWVKPFWGCLVSRGAHAIGLREKHWIASEARLPCFPSDFPDCNSYSCYMETKAADTEEKLKLCPPAMRPFMIPIPPPWESIRFAVNIESVISKDAHSEEPCEINDIGALSHCGSSFEGFVARTSEMLAQFLSEIHGDHLLLFPHSFNVKDNVVKFMKDDGRLGERSKGATPLINYGKRLCFLRVVLDAHRGGVFEEGAVVCASHYSDIASCTSRSDNDKKEIQIPQSTVRSYFKQQPSGKWNLQVPEDPTAKACHRWPIGFITTGFVRGSKKPSAIALCEATWLAHLREEQWIRTPVKPRRKEIYVLVRNLRSTAYRLALATIVLENQNDVVVG